MPLPTYDDIHSEIYNTVKKHPLAVGLPLVLAPPLAISIGAGLWANKKIKEAKRVKNLRQAQYIVKHTGDPKTNPHVAQLPDDYDNAYFVDPGTIDGIHKSDKTLKDYGVEADLNSRQMEKARAQGLIGYSPKKTAIPGIIAHEAGHADVDANGNFIERNSQKYLYGLGALAPITGWMAAKISHRGSGIGILPSAGVGALVSGAMAAPMLLSEFAATRRAKNFIDSPQGARIMSEEERRKNKSALNAALGTYLAATIAAPAVGSLMSNWIHTQPNSMKTASLTCRKFIIKDQPKQKTAFTRTSALLSDIMSGKYDSVHKKAGFFGALRPLAGAGVGGLVGYKMTKDYDVTPYTRAMFILGDAAAGAMGAKNPRMFMMKDGGKMLKEQFLIPVGLSHAIGSVTNIALKGGKYINRGTNLLDVQTAKEQELLQKAIAEAQVAEAAANQISSIQKAKEFLTKTPAGKALLVGGAGVGLAGAGGLAYLAYQASRAAKQVGDGKLSSGGGFPEGSIDSDGAKRIPVFGSVKMMDPSYIASKKKSKKDEKMQQAITAQALMV